MLSSRPFAIHDEYEPAVHAKLNPLKTPGRALKGRAGLQENALASGTMSTNPGEKRANLKTPFRKENNRIILKDAPASTKATTLLPSRPLLDKTPAPNRQNSSTLFTPVPNGGKISKSLLPVLIDEAESLSPAQPPSSSRKKLRVPRSSNSNRAFETPVNTGDHWNVSDISIAPEGSSLDNVEENAMDEPDYSDPEYMPPKAKDPPFEMPFELPNYKEVGEALLASAYSYPVVGGSPQFPEPDVDELLESCKRSTLLKRMDSEEDLSDDDISGPAKKVTSKSKTSTRTASATSIPRLATAMPKANAMRSKTKTQTKAPSRPATAASTTRTRGPIMPRPKTSASAARPVSFSVTSVKSNARRIRLQKAPAEDLILTFDDKDLELPEDDFRFTL